MVGTATTYSNIPQLTFKKEKVEELILRFQGNNDLRFVYLQFIRLIAFN